MAITVVYLVRLREVAETEVAHSPMGQGRFLVDPRRAQNKFRQGDRVIFFGQL